MKTLGNSWDDGSSGVGFVVRLSKDEHMVMLRLQRVCDSGNSISTPSPDERLTKDLSNPLYAILRWIDAKYHLTELEGVIASAKKAIELTEVKS